MHNGGMDIFITHTTAALFWLNASQRLPSTRASRRFAGIPPTSVTPNPSLLANIRRLFPRAPIIDVTVASPCSKRNTVGCRTHYATGALPPGSFLPVASSLYLATPEYCLLQLAPALDSITWIRLAHALCGTYMVEADGELTHRESGVTNSEALRTFLTRSTGQHGAKQMRRRLPYVLDAADSPMETQMSLQVHLPKTLGGYLLPKGVLNRRFSLGANGRFLAEKRYYKADLCWPEQRVIVEYDSDAYHTGSARIAADARRRNVWLHLGYTPITITRPQLFDRYEFDRVIRQVHKALGKRYRQPTPAQWDAKRALHRNAAVPLGELLCTEHSRSTDSAR